MKENRARWLDLVRRVEGDAFSDDPRDPGGACRFGVTIPTLAAWRRQPVTAEDIKRLEWPECAELYSARYWNTTNADKLPPGLDVAVADMAVHSGTRQAAKLLQRVLNVKVDGHVGPKTLEAARGWDLPELIERFGEARLAFLQRLAGWTTFGKGWLNRVTAVQAEAERLAEAQAAQAPEPTPLVKSRVTTQAVVAAVGAAVAALPAARDAYQQATAATASLGEVAVWLPAAIGLLVALGTLAMLARRGLRLADQQ